MARGGRKRKRARGSEGDGKKGRASDPGSGYAAAGILPVRRVAERGRGGVLRYKLQALVGQQWKRKNGYEGFVLTGLGGKREARDARDAAGLDGPASTAWREFWEEAGRLPSDALAGLFRDGCRELLRGDSGGAGAGWVRRVYVDDGAYWCYILDCTLGGAEGPRRLEELHALPEAYAAAYGAGQERPADADMHALHWVDVEALLAGGQVLPGAIAYPFFRAAVLRHGTVRSVLRAIEQDEPR